MGKVTIWKCSECNAILRERLEERYCENFPQGSSFVCGGILDKWVELDKWAEGFENENLGNNGEPIKNINPEVCEDQVELERLSHENK